MSETDEHLRTDHLEADLAVRSARGSAVTMVAQGTKFAVGIAATVLLARLLRPADFGLAAMALATAGILARLKDAGLFTATLQSPHVTQQQASALFWVSAALAAAVAVVTVALAPAVGWFYHDARLVAVTMALAGIPLLDGLTLQLQAVMARQMRFVSLSVMDAGAMATGAVGALVLATAGAGYWSLVGQELVYSAAYAAAIWSVCRWRPGPPRRQSGVRPMLAFGLNLSAFRILNYLTMNLDTVFVGRFRGAEQAGIYDRAYRVLTIPATLLNQPMTTVAVPALSRLHGDTARYRLFYTSWLQFVFGLTMPLVVFLFVDAERAVLTILGVQWVGLVPIYRMLAPAAFIGRLNLVTNWLYVTTGRTDRQLRWAAFLIVPMVVAYAIGVRWDAFGVAAAHTVVTCVLWYPGVAFCCRTAPVRPREVLGVMAFPAVSSVAAGLGLWALQPLLFQRSHVAAQFLVDFLVYAALYGMTWMAVPGGRRRLEQFIALGRAAIGPRPVRDSAAIRGGVKPTPA